MRQSLRTLIRHEKLSNKRDTERGSRYWSAAEILTPTWFVLETCIEVGGVNKIKNWVTTSISDAANLQDSQRPFIWSQIYVCLRAPQSVRLATVFEVVNEAYHLGAVESYLYRLDNGMSFTSSEGQGKGICLEPSEIRLVYSKPR